ncbi:MAG: LL-diaminopimelate aminotransferase [Syntrophomonadaceae bacterium]|nr:LL-diaminopimelate aminotransferase [Syntrophomonadaceae bacterium]
MQENLVMGKLPPYLFARIEKKIEEAREKGIDIINLGIGDPDQPTPEHIIARAAKAMQDPANHQYPSSVGMLTYRQEVAAWYRRRFGVELDPRSEVVSLIGSKEGIANISACFLNPGDTTLVPDPSYPVYSIGTILCGATPYKMPLLAENGFLPQLKDIPAEVARKAKILFINYPNNPTGAVANDEFYQEVIAFAKEYGILICHDAAYSEIFFDNRPARSFLEYPGAKEVGIEFHSVSKTYNMTGWRIGWAAGNSYATEVLGRYKSNIDSGAFQVVQYAAMEALSGPQDCVEDMRSLYQARRDVVVAGLRRMGWSIEAPPGSIYVWAPVPKGYSSSSFAELVLEKAGVIITQGIGYGEYGEGYFRIALTVDKDRMEEALQRMEKAIGKVEF